jgi:hypothetical protein
MRDDDEQGLLPDRAAGDRRALSTVDVEIAPRRQGTTHPLQDQAVTSEDRIEGRLVEQEDGKLVLFYGPI